MTTLRRPVVRIVSTALFSQGRCRPLVVSLKPPGDVLGLRLKGERRTYWLPLGWCYAQAVRLAVAQKRATKSRKGNTA